MEQSLLFNIKKRYPNLKKGNRIPATGRYIVDYSKKHYWQNKDLGIAVQNYDVRDAHLSLVEIKTDIPLILPIRCLRPDLGWFYQLAGSSLLKHLFKNGNGGIVISEKEYRINYASKGEYLLIVQPGYHLFLFFTINSEWFLRQQEEYYTHFDIFRKAIREKPLAWKVSKSMPISYHVLKEMVLLLNMKKQKGIKMETSVYSYIAELINISHADKSKLLPIESTGSMLAHTLREIIKGQIQEEEVSTLKEIAFSLGASVGHLRRVHMQYHHISAQAYFIDEKMKEAMRLLNQEGLSVKETTFRLGYSRHSSLYKASPPFFLCTLASLPPKTSLIR